MNKRTRFAIVLTVAVTTASVSSFAVYRVAARRPAVRAAAAPIAHLVVATHSLPLGARVTAADVRLVEWPVQNVVPASFSKVEEVVGRGLIAAVVENEPLTNAKLAPRAAGAGLSSAIPPGQRAISIKVNEVIGVAGFVLPGTRVDVIAALRDGRDSTAHVLVSNVRVLTAGTRYDQSKADDLKPTVSTVVTLAVTPEQAQRIALAQAEGQLTLTLRNPLDADESTGKGVDLAALRGEPVVKIAPPAPAAPRAPRPAQPAVAVAAPAQPKGYRVETIVAGKRTEDSLK
jgi:pilus assembly protein CpaB